MNMKSLITAAIFTVTAPTFALANEQVETCKATILQAADTIQSIAKKVPNRAFGKFTKNGRWLPLALAVTSIGNGNPYLGAQRLFKTAKPTFDKYESRILKAAKACVGECDDVRSLHRRCDEVQDLADLLNDLDFSKGYEIAQAIASYGGTDGVKRAVKKEVAEYYKDRN